MFPADRNPIYLDHAAATHMVPAAVVAMNQILGTAGNASSLHGSGRRARRQLEESRESIAASLGGRPSEVIFTGGGTESDNLAVKGIFWARNKPDAARPKGRPRIIASAIEHHAVLDPVLWLADSAGAEVTWLPVDSRGFVAPAELRAELAAHADETALVSVMWANNEVGTIAPVAELAAICREFDVPMHSDAIQAAGHLPIDFASSGLSAMSVAGHKFGGPHGIGALMLGRDVECVPLLHGGGHERDVRSGTPDVAAAVGMAVALDHSVRELATAMPAVAALRDRLFDVLMRSTDDCVINGPLGDDRLPGNVHVSFPGCEGDSLLMLLDANGIECSTGSACTAGVAQASHVLTAMGVSTARARSSLRFSLAPSTTAEEIDAVGAVIGEVVSRARAAGMATAMAGER
ncbi:cysteine desulfurase [Williamsia limnetica]|jgi:cysteine desulfurase|uniref:Cysteine desulfurase n=1 Tax=Williamsia limnetica TaxID=882452 RepID=A0A318RFS1_WILLI|nr:cysteine desulfurase family protein [Williamsia limnetica]PYE15588.1 cysteine desulfurase [Williamsia limnetica]